MNDFAVKLARVLNDIESMLVEKNRKYGNSALEPVRIFSKASPLEQLKVRMDDKLSRLRSAQDDEDEDVIDDLLGYLLIYKVATLKRSDYIDISIKVDIKDQIGEIDDVVVYCFSKSEPVSVIMEHGFKKCCASDVVPGDILDGYGKVLGVADAY